MRQLERYFKLRFGSPPELWLNQMRIERAVSMITTGSSAKEISFELGFRHPSHFTRVFKRATGQTPVEYRQAFANESLNRQLSGERLPDRP